MILIFVSIISFPTLGKPINQNSSLNHINEDLQLLGIDSNKNNVRDEVENYITKYMKILEPKKYRAYFNYAQTLSLKLKHRRSKEMLNQLDKQSYDDLYCIYGVDGLENGASKARDLKGKVLESYLRLQAWDLAESTKGINTFAHLDKKDWLTKCR